MVLFLSPFHLISEQGQSGSFGGQPCAAVYSEAPSVCLSEWVLSG